LTCTDLNCVEKSGIQKYANELGVIVVFPDTSPRGLGYEGEAESWDFGMRDFYTSLICIGLSIRL
jgi:S-formylglutathione hydrolase